MEYQEYQLREAAAKLLREGKVKVVIGYGQTKTGRVTPVFITRPEDAEQLVWNSDCHQNLVVFLTRPEVKRLGKPAIVVKPCDARAIVVLGNEAQIMRDQVYAIGMVCKGVNEDQGRPSSRCAICHGHYPKHVDLVIGEAEDAPKDLTKEERRQSGKYLRIAEIRALSPEERLAYWKEEFSRCVRCYACRQCCPLCYCNRCVADKNRPVRIPTSASLQGNFAWNILRAFHLAGRCVSCGACSAACPAGIDLNLINLTLADMAEEHFDYLAGSAVGTLPLIGTFSESDKEDFIR
ncbi:MAG: 4Fe-4S dicluster domain-containing protein [Thermoguttaceae bacterium]|jgi:formate dehydrogenase subunit beta